MPAIKKTKHAFLPPSIVEKEALDALEILVYESPSYDAYSNKFRVSLSSKTAPQRRVFMKTYGHSCKDTLGEILAWSAYIFPNGMTYSPTEILKRFVESVLSMPQRGMKEPELIRFCHEGTEVSRKSSLLSSMDWS